MVTFFFGAGDEARTRYLHLGKVALYRMSYTRGTRDIITDIFYMSIPFLKKSSKNLSYSLANIFRGNPCCNGRIRHPKPDVPPAR